MSPPPSHLEPHAPAARDRAADADLFCLICDYDLRSLTVERCPECGTPFDPAARAPRRVPWGPLVWEAHDDRSWLDRLRLTFFGLLRHPITCLQHLGATPKPFGRRQLLFLLCVLAFTVLLAGLTTAGLLGRNALMARLALSGRNDSTFLIWAYTQLGWWDGFFAYVIHAGVVFHTVGVLALIGKGEDLHRDLALLALGFGLVVVTAVLKPSPLAAVPIGLVAAATCALLALTFHRVDWPRLITRTARNFTYLFAMLYGFRFFLWIPYYFAYAASNLRLLAPEAAASVDHGWRIAAAVLFAVVLYWFVRHTFHVRPLRAVGAAALYVAVDRYCLEGIDALNAPVRAFLVQVHVLEHIVP